MGAALLSFLSVPGAYSPDHLKASPIAVDFFFHQPLQLQRTFIRAWNYLKNDHVTRLNSPVINYLPALNMRLSSNFVLLTFLGHGTSNVFSLPVDTLGENSVAAREYHQDVGTRRFDDDFELEPRGYDEFHLEARDFEYFDLGKREYSDFEFEPRDLDFDLESRAAQGPSSAKAAPVKNASEMLAKICHQLQGRSSEKKLSNAKMDPNSKATTGFPIEKKTISSPKFNKAMTSTSSSIVNAKLKESKLKPSLQRGKSDPKSEDAKSCPSSLRMDPKSKLNKLTTSGAKSIKPLTKLRNMTSAKDRKFGLEASTKLTKVDSKSKVDLKTKQADPSKSKTGSQSKKKFDATKQENDAMRSYRHHHHHKSNGYCRDRWRQNNGGYCKQSYDRPYHPAAERPYRATDERTYRAEKPYHTSAYDGYRQTVYDIGFDSRYQEYY
ncbi:hypothetical protein BDQ12DRAFT_737597 [Crucibulum laeve]|uniref:Uncharacterized protein n=1 Tax=Crucibulum laeve TaxID=68775 RepID=A0A5C3LR11_9AGAR|nr:hypothetical protein BDQ12DRAFT_737597 [Crucibulum laeve]